MIRLLAALSFLLLLVVDAMASDPLVISGQSNQTYSNLSISSMSGDCVQIINSTNITIESSQIGPCAGDGVHISGGSGNKVYDSYIHVENLASGCCDTRDGVRVDGTSGFDTIQGNVIAFSETNVRVDSSSHDIFVNGNFLLNPRGPFPRGEQFQSDTVSNMFVENNYTVSSTDASYPFSGHQEDAINFFNTGPFTAQGNYVTGGQSSSGCGIIADFSANNGMFKSNLLHNTGQCGISIADGVGHVIDSNKILNENPIAGGGNTALPIWKQYKPPCGGTGANQITVSDNIADERRSDGTHYGFWNGGGCDRLNLVNNTFNLAAYNILHPWTIPPPAVPPLPVNCVVVSPYTNNTSMGSCSGSPP